jgi:hypothetical protein
MKDAHPVRGRFGNMVGVIVYTMPAPNVEMRNVATGSVFGGVDRRLGLRIVNENVRCIRRVIIEPRYRGLGLASHLVAETMPKLNVPIVESIAVMARFNPFFEKAGMKGWVGRPQLRTVRLIEALGMVGVGEDEFIDPEKVHVKLTALKGAESRFINGQIERFLQSYGGRRYMEPGLERTRYVLSRLSSRPAYYIWFNPEKKIVTNISKEVS